MELFSNFFARGWDFFWSIWPKNFWLLIFIAAIAEALSVTVFRLGENRGWLAILGYIIGFLVIAFYAEGQKYSSLSISYLIWLVTSASLIGLSAFFIFHEQFSWTWILGFILAIIGVFMMQTVTPKS